MQLILSRMISLQLYTLILDIRVRVYKEGRLLKDLRTTYIDEVHVIKILVIPEEYCCLVSTPLRDHPQLPHLPHKLTQHSSHERLSFVYRLCG